MLRYSSGMTLQGGSWDLAEHFGCFEVLIFAHTKKLRSTKSLPQCNQ